MDTLNCIITLIYSHDAPAPTKLEVVHNDGFKDFYGSIDLSGRGRCRQVLPAGCAGISLARRGEDLVLSMRFRSQGIRM